MAQGNFVIVWCQNTFLCAVFIYFGKKTNTKKFKIKMSFREQHACTPFVLDEMSLYYIFGIILDC
jgi:hypothetical protein